MFNSCEICGTDQWSIIYEGPIRSGAFGKQIEKGTVGQCSGCGVARLDEQLSITAAAYESDDYRAILEQGLAADDFFKEHDITQIQNLSAFWPLKFRDKVIADIGCGAGSFLDHVSGLAKEIVAIEPTEHYHNSLRKRGYTAYSYVADAVAVRPASIDVAVTFQVIEHVLNPSAFLSEIAALLKPGGTLIIATPNHDDILMKLLPEEFPSFYYRTFHRWYFDRISLFRCVEEVEGLHVESERCFHGFGMSNTLSWMKDRKPKGHTRLPGINNTADSLWINYLETTGQADTLYILARKAS